ncbi:MAG TPA: AIR synthase-related protein [Spirochaetota bacterium]|nr:AIR synthase-related protein [Spirochaetota bacterium]
MFNRVEICGKSAGEDGKARGIELIIEEDLGLKVDDIRIVEAYNFQGDFSNDEILTLRNSLFCDKVYQNSFVGFHHLTEEEYDFAIEVAYKTGVTDNVGKTASKGMEYILKRDVKENDVKSSTLYLFRGNIKKNDIELIASKVLCNTLIEDYYIFYRTNAKKSIDYKFNFEIAEKIKPYEVVNLEVSDEELMKISREGILSLSLEEMTTIRDYYRDEKVKSERKAKDLPDNPTDIELELFAQTWSEHCKHKIFAAEITYENCGEVKVIDSLFKTYIKRSAEIIKEKRDDLLSLFKDNSGVVKFNDEWAYCVKVETHNSPSALDPYGGAMTGIVGVNRDILGTGIGAYPIFNTDVFCFGDPFIDNKEVPDGLLHPRRIFRGVHRGIKDGGNESGIPTVNGSISFDNSFLGKPLVFCGTGGLLPLKVNGKDSYEKYTKSGDLIVMVGGKIGKDGIHGATFSSDHLSEKSPTSAVQIGDPITQKKMVDFIIEARDKDLYSGLTDNGAGGLASSVGEMATFTNGAVLYLEKCPLKYSGLKPWEILLSEAQERMTVSVPKDKIDDFLELSKLRDVESTAIGEFTENGLFECFYNGERISSVSMNFLHNGVPKYKLKAKWKNNENCSNCSI